MNGVSGVQSSNPYQAPNTAANEPAGAAATQNSAVNSQDEAAVFEKSAAAAEKVTYKRDNAAVAEIHAKDKAYIQNLQNVVTMMLEQLNTNQLASSGSKFLQPIDPSKVDSYWDLLIDNGDGTFSWHPDISPEMQDSLIAKAKEDIGENGYYGVKQTSQRILDFAKAVTGGDPSKIGLMREYIQKGFDEVEKMFGGKLPEISYQTLKAVMDGLDEWAAGTK
ncbi:MAG: hypothetical protein FWG31_00225 [Oscillospiraceae bacterium]|nr:hypothetical protein [Oscillospiraceae bacterium]